MKDLRTLNRFRDNDLQKEIVPSFVKRSLSGVFKIKLKTDIIAFVIADNGVSSPDWEHVSVSTKDRCLTWEEMCEIKDLFWSEDEAVIQIHPAKSEYVNIAKNCLHLWKYKNGTFPLPDEWLVV